MTFDLIQSLCLPGDFAIANDDRAGSTGGLAWVIDGATDLGPAGLVGAQGGAAWLADQANALLAGADAARPVADLLADLTARLAARFAVARRRDPLGAWELPCASLMLARHAGDAIECGWLGDCVGLLHGPAGTRRLGRPRVSRDAETAHAASNAAHGLGTVKGREGPLIDSLREARARPGRAVLGVDGAADRVEIARYPCAPGDALLLMTDGFAALCDSYDRYDEAGLAQGVVTRGAAALAQELRAVEREDADCTRFVRFKTSDDATLLHLRVAG
ncbi:protein phosphatase 2C domain-containing protein [Sphingomonas sp. CJ20]